MKNITRRSQLEHHKLDASFEFYRHKFVIKWHKAYWLYLVHQVAPNLLNSDLFSCNLIQVVETTCIKLVVKKS